LGASPLELFLLVSLHVLDLGDDTMSVADPYQIHIQMGKLIRIKEGHSGFQELHWMEGWRLLLDSF
jgi:hypothetical protein